MTAATSIYVEKRRTNTLTHRLRLERERNHPICVISVYVHILRNTMHAYYRLQLLCACDALLCSHIFSLLFPRSLFGTVRSISPLFAHHTVVVHAVVQSE